MTQVYYVRREGNFWWAEDASGNNVSDELEKLHRQDVPPEAAGSYIVVGVVAAANAAHRVRLNATEV